MRLNSLWISRKKYVLAPLVLLVLLLAIAACGSDSSITQSDAAMEAERMEAEAMAMEEEKKEAEAMVMEEEKMEAEAMAMEEEKMEAGISLQLDLSGVDPLANGYHYEGWAIIGGDPVSTGKFNIGPNGAIVGLDGKIKTDGVFHSLPRWERQPTL